MGAHLNTPSTGVRQHLVHGGVLFLTSDASGRGGGAPAVMAVVDERGRHLATLCTEYGRRRFVTEDEMALAIVST